MTTPTVDSVSVGGPRGSGRFAWWADNAGKRRTEQVYVAWFLATLPIQAWVTSRLSYDQPNDLALVTQGVVMGLGALVLPVVLRASEDRGVPLRELYAVRMGVFLVVWACLGGFIGTDPWYEVLHGHFAFNTELNPNGVPLFMLPMTIAVFGFYSAVLGVLYRVLLHLLTRITGGEGGAVRHVLLCLALAGVMPLVETLAYSSENYCFDNETGKWGLNVLIYGSWHLASLLFYTRWDRHPGERTLTFHQTLVAAFATIGLLMCLMAFTKTAIAPHVVDVDHGLRNINDWSTDNCLGPKPA